MARKGLYANIHAKRKRIAKGSGETMRTPGSPGAPKASDFKNASKTAKPKKKYGGSVKKRVTKKRKKKK